MERAELKQVIVEQLTRIAPDIEPAQIPEQGDLRDALDLDSMDFVRLVSALHKQLGVDIPEADYGQVQSLAGLLDYLQRNM